MKKRFLSLIIALAMMVGVFTPLIASAADETTESVTLHKLMMTKEELKAWNSDAIEKAGYNGTQDTTALKKFLAPGHTAHEVADVFFAWKFGAGHTGFTDTETEKFTAETNLTDKTPAAIAEGKYVKADPKDATKPLVLSKKVNDVTTKYLVATDNIEEAMGKETANNGIKFTTSDLKGAFEIDEIKEKSTYKNDKNVIVDQKAVPVKITLPLVNDKGVVKNAHVYPKNTEDKPVIDKNFKKAANKEKELKEAEGFPKAADGAGIGVGANYDNYQKNKATAKVSVGDVVPYEVKTKIAAETSYEKLVWNDIMTNGLTYNKDLGTPAKYNKKGNSYEKTDSETPDLETGIKVLVENKELKDTKDPKNPYLVKDTDYKIVEDDNGFRLQFEKSGLDKIAAVTKTHEETKEGQKTTVVGKDVEIELTYTATVNGTAKVDNPEKNNVTLEYGHKPGSKHTPKDVTPKDGKLKVIKKVQDNGDAVDPSETNAKDLKLVYTLRKGDKAYSVALTVANKASKDPIDLGNGIKFTVTGLFAGEFSGLGEDTTGWTIEERVAGYNPEYAETNEIGKVTITNKKDNENPTPLEPTTPEVVTGGKKFVKTNQDGSERLAGAKFVVKGAEGVNKDKYLAVKSVDTVKDEQEKLANAKAALDTAVKKYNERTNDDNKDTLAEEIKNAQDSYNEAFKTAGTRYEWADSKDEKGKTIVTLASNKDGQFMIEGLAYGKYKLEEIEAPKGYAIQGDVEFTIAKGETTDVKIAYETGENKPVNAKQVINKKVTIPQTGGIGTIIFTAIGLAIMASAIIAIKKRQATEAR